MTPTPPAPGSPQPPSPPPSAAPSTRRSVLPWLIGLVVLAVAGWYGWQAWQARSAAAASAAASAAGDGGGPPPGMRGPGGGFGGGPGRSGGPNFTTPVTALAATMGAMPERIGALGTVTARATVTVRAQVAGRLDKLLFEEGQMVKAGQVLAQIDPRSFQVALDSAQAQLERDQAQLAGAEVDLKRYQTLLVQDSIASQQVDTQVATVAQLRATVAADRAAVAQAKLQLGYARVTAPISGRTGLRQVDVGNLVQTTDTNGLVVITEVTPIAVLFPIPQQRLPVVLERLKAGATLAVEAWDGDNRKLLASGKLVTVDNQIDTTTGTVKLKAEFPNRDGALFPNQFVNVRMTVNTLENVVLIPTAAVQQGSRGPYVFVVREDDTVTQRQLRVGPSDGTQQSVLQGVATGERVVVDGIDRLREGMKVQVLAQREAPVAAPNSGRRRERRGTGASAPAGAGSAASASAPATGASAAQAGDGSASRPFHRRASEPQS